MRDCYELALLFFDFFVFGYGPRLTDWIRKLSIAVLLWSAAVPLRPWTVAPVQEQNAAYNHRALQDCESPPAGSLGRNRPPRGTRSGARFDLPARVRSHVGVVRRK